MGKLGRWMGVAIALLAPVPAAPAEAPGSPASAQQAALGLVDALRRGDEEGALARGLDYAGWESISRRRLDRARNEAELAQFVRGLAHELEAGLRVDDPVLADVLVLPPDEKLKRQVVLAVFHLRLFPPGAPVARPPVIDLCFVEHAGRWQLILRD